MILRLASRRHRWRGRTTCDMCGAYPCNTARIYWSTTDPAGKAVDGQLDICAACFREGAKVATEGRRPLPDRRAS